MRFDRGGTDEVGWGRLVPFRPRPDELTVAQIDLAETLAKYRLPSGRTLKRLLALLERDRQLLWAVRLVAEQLPRSVVKVVDVGIELEDFDDDDDPIVWIEGYSSAGGKEAARSHQGFVRDVIVQEVYGRQIYGVNSTIRFV